MHEKIDGYSVGQHPMVEGGAGANLQCVVTKTSALSLNSPFKVDRLVKPRPDRLAVQTSGGVICPHTLAKQ